MARVVRRDRATEEDSTRRSGAPLLRVSAGSQAEEQRTVSRNVDTEVRCTVSVGRVSTGSAPVEGAGRGGVAAGETVGRSAHRRITGDAGGVHGVVLGRRMGEPGADVVVGTGSARAEPR